MIYEDDEVVDDARTESVEHRESNVGTITLAVLAGAAIGAAIALMMAPRTGQDMRRVLRSRAAGLRQTAGHAMHDTTDELSRQLRRRSRQVRRKLDRMG